MFADSLLESHWADRSRRGWTTFLSFAAQVLGLAILLSLPLLYTEGLPTFKMIAGGAPLTAPPEEPNVTEERPATGLHSASTAPLVVHQNFHPVGLPPVEPVGGEAPPCSNCLPSMGEAGPVAGILNSIGSAPPPVPVPPKPVAKPPIVSHMMEGNLIYRAQPIYPALAQAGRVQGVVVLRAVISRAGTIENLQVLSGHPLLTNAAIAAVRQWRYRPYVLNGEPVEVETQVTVNFILGGG
jgi:protein TonB